MNLQENIRKVLREETDPKKEGLLNLIKGAGLYDFIKDTGLSYSDIYHRMGELPREVKIQYLKDAINDLEQSPDHLDLTFLTGSIPLYENDYGQMVYVDSLSNEDNVLIVYFATFYDDGDVDLKMQQPFRDEMGITKVGDPRAYAEKVPRSEIR